MRIINFCATNIFTLTTTLREYLKYGIYFVNCIIERNFAYRYVVMIQKKYISECNIWSDVADRFV